MVVVALSARHADAQTLGSVSWQLQPFCNKVTVNVTQTGAIYTLDADDDQCEAAQRAPLTGLATPNPDGTIGFGLNIVTVPGEGGREDGLVMPACEKFNVFVIKQIGVSDQ